MEEANNFSEITNRLQELSQTKGGSVFTGSEFYKTYGVPSRARDEEPNETIAYIAGEIQNAYSKIKRAYSTTKGVHEQNKNKLDLHDDDVELNVERIIGLFERASNHLEEALEMIDSIDEEEYDWPPSKLKEFEWLEKETRSLKKDIESYKKHIKNTKIVVLS